MADPNLSSFIWSVADLLRGDYKKFFIERRRLISERLNEFLGTAEKA
jgi:hypothetical protein